MASPGSGLVDWVLRRLEPASEDLAHDTVGEVALTTAPLRLALPAPPFRLRMGEQCLDFHPDPMLVDIGDGPGTIIALDPQRDGTLAHPALRIAAGEERLLDAEDRAQRGLFSAPEEVRRRRLLITHEGDALVLRVAAAEPPTVVSIRNPEPAPVPLLDSRRRALAALIAVFGPRFDPLPPDAALDTLLAVTREMEADTAWQPRDTRGLPGALLELPDGLRLILIGDIHGHVDNLLSVLTRNDYLAAVETGHAALVFLGDLVHHDAPTELEQMRSSMLVMDLVLALKRRHPRGVFMLLGNHDGFSGEIMKGGVPQGLLWDKALRAERGDAYREALSRFYAISPMVMRASGCCACHAGPPTMAVTRRDLIDAHCNPPLAHDLRWTRCAGPGVTHGYRASDVRQLRRVLGLPRGADLVVGHYPRSEADTVWMDSDHISGHDVVFSARDRVVGVLQATDRELVPQVFPVESIASAVATEAG